MLFDWIRRLTRKKNMRFKRFDIVVKGEGMKNPEQKFGVQAANEAQLRSLFAMTGE